MKQVLIEFKEALKDALPIQTRTLAAVKIMLTNNDSNMGSSMMLTVAEHLLESFRRSETKFIIVECRYMDDERGIGHFAMTASMYVEKVLTQEPFFSHCASPVRAYLDLLGKESREVAKMKFPIITQTLEKTIQEGE